MTGINRLWPRGMQCINGQGPDDCTGGAGIHPNPAPVSAWLLTEDLWAERLVQPRSFGQARSQPLMHVGADAPALQQKVLEAAGYVRQVSQ